MANKFGTEINITPDQLETLKLIRRHKPFPQDDKMLLDLISKGLLFAETYIDYDGTATDGYAEIRDLTPAGHEFLANIRQDNNWNKTKEVAKKIGSFSLTGLRDIASNIIANAISSHFK